MRPVAMLERRCSSINPLQQFLASIARSDRGRSVVFMKAAIICLALVLGTPALGEEAAPKHRIALMSRITCPAIREAVKLYGEAAAEQWARGHGVSEERIEQAKRCLK